MTYIIRVTCHFFLQSNFDTLFTSITNDTAGYCTQVYDSMSAFGLGFHNLFICIYPLFSIYDHIQNTIGDSITE
jgi:hypothetical protein